MPNAHLRAVVDKHDEIPAPPTGLTEEATALWLSYVGDYLLSERELALLREACLIVTELSLMRAALAESSILTTGSTGQPVVNKVLAEMTSHRSMLTRVLRELGEPV